MRKILDDEEVNSETKQTLKRAPNDAATEPEINDIRKEPKAKDVSKDKNFIFHLFALLDLF